MTLPDAIGAAVALVLPVVPAVASPDAATVLERYGVAAGLVVIVVLSSIASTRRRERRDETRENRLIAGFGRLAASVDRQTAAVLAAVTSDPLRMDEIAERLSHDGRECGTCALLNIPRAERATFGARLAHCTAHYRDCEIARALELARAKGAS